MASAPIKIEKGSLSLDWSGEPAKAATWDPYLVLADITGKLQWALARRRRDAAFFDDFCVFLIEISDSALFDATWQAFTAQYPSKLNTGSKTKFTPTHREWLKPLHKARESRKFTSIVFPPELDILGEFIRRAWGPDSGVARLELSAPRDFWPGDNQTPLDEKNWKWPEVLLRLESKGLTVDTSVLRKLTRPLDAVAKKFRDSARRPGEHVSKDARAEEPTKQPPSISPRASARIEISPVFVAVLDDRCNYAAYPPKLVATVWDQNIGHRRRNGLPGGHGNGGDAFQPPASGSYGRELTRTRASDGEPDEPNRYRRDDYFFPTHHWSHGSAILHLLVSRLVWVRDEPIRLRSQPQSVHVVQFPDSTVLDTGGGSLASHALDGVLDALSRAPPNSQVIVNLSFGTNSGGHDGHSMFESALRWLLDFYDGSPVAEGKRLHVVVPAGNTQRWRCHAQKTLSPAQPTMVLQWRVFPDNPVPNFVEVWVGSPDDVVVTVKPPGELAATCKAGEIHAWESNEPDRQKRKKFGAVIFGRKVSLGTGGGMALVAAGPTNPGVYRRGRRTGSEAQIGESDPVWARAPHGIWEICVTRKDKGAGCIPVHAWVQRADAAPARNRDEHGFDDRQSYFLDGDPSDVEPQLTLNGIGTLVHDRFFVAGSMRESDFGLSTYSSAGPDRGDGGRFEGPDLVEAVDRSHSLPGQLVCGGLSGARIRVSGTSLAAAILSRRLHEHLEAGFSASSFRGLPCTHLDPSRDPPRSPADPKLADNCMRGEYRRLPLRAAQGKSPPG